jgi:DNA-binding MarR family transcriptional regulator
VPSDTTQPPEARPQQRLSLLLEIYSVHARMGALVGRELDVLGVDSSDYAALSAIGAFGPIRLKELSSLLGMPLTTMSDVVRRLEKREALVRRPHPADGRSQLLELSAEGDREWRAGWPALQKATEAIVTRLEAPEDDVRDALRRLEAALASALTET